MMWGAYEISILVTLFVGLYFLILSLLVFLDGYRNQNEKKRKRENFTPFVSLIVPAYNEEKNIKKTLLSLVKLQYPKDKLEVIVIDDGSEDRTYEIAVQLSKKYPNIKVFKKKNGGKGSALNFGIKKSKGEIIGTVDADSIVKKDALKKMLPHFLDKNVMAVTSSLKSINPRNFCEKIQYIEYLAGIFLRKVLSFINSLYITPGPFTLYRANFFKMHGGFREDVITEDMEMGLRIVSNNYKIENVIDAEVRTVVPKNFKSLLKQRLRWYVGSLDLIFGEYRYLLFNPSYGVLGLLILPIAYIVTLFGIAIFCCSLVLRIKDMWKFIHSLQLINFDILTLIKNPHFSFSLYWGYLTLPSSVTVLLSVTIILVAIKYSRERKIKWNFIAYYQLFYWFLFSLWWLIAVIYKITGKEISFGNLLWKNGKVYIKHYK